MSLLGKKILNLLNNPSKAKKHSKQMISFDDSQRIGIIYTWVDKAKMTFIEEFTQSLEKEVAILSFNPSKDLVDTIHPIFNIDELSALGKLKSEVADTFLRKQFDYLFVLDFDLSEVTQHLIVNCNAICRVGCHIDDAEEYFDLMIGVNENAGIANFAEQLLKYVKTISNG